MRANRRDHNQATLQKVFERRGCVVFDSSRVGGGFPDLVVDHRGRTYLVETKNPKTAYGRRGLNKNQQNFARRRSAKVWVALSESEVEAVVDRWEHEQNG